MTWHHWKDFKTGMTTLCVFTGKHYAFAYDIPAPKEGLQDVPALEIGPIEIECAFDSDDELRAVQVLGMEALRRRINALDSAT